MTKKKIHLNILKKRLEFSYFNTLLMTTQRYKIYLVHLLLVLTIIFFAGCGSARLAQIDSKATVRSSVETLIKAMNTEDINTIEVLYADDFKSYAPIYDLPKKELIKSIQTGFEKQDHKIQAKITEIISSPSLATVQLEWMIINKNKEVIFAQNLLQIWKKNKTDWKLSRILFYTANEVLQVEDF